MEPRHGIGVADYTAMQGVASAARYFAFRYELAEQLGLQIHTPFLDHAVIRACLRVAAHKRSRSSHFKSILYDALQGLVPAEVLQRQSKASPVSGTYRGGRQQAANLRLLLGPDSHLAQLNITDPKAIDSAINHIELGLDEVPQATLVQAVSTELWLRSHYGQPAALSSLKNDQTKIPVNKVKTQLPLRLYAPEHVKFVADVAGLLAYNMRTGEAISLHNNAAKLVQLLQYNYSPERIVSLLQDANPMADPLAISYDIHEIMANLVRNGIFSTEGCSTFSIARAIRNTNDLTADLPMNPRDIDTSDLRLGDYLRMSLSLPKAIRLLKSTDLAAITSKVHNLKIDFPPAESNNVRRLLTAGHVLKRWYPGRIACLELSLAAVLAEARSGRSVDLCIGTAPDPRRYHAWPEVAGVPIQTPRDEIVEGQYTKFGTW